MQWWKCRGKEEVLHSFDADDQHDTISNRLVSHMDKENVGRWCDTQWYTRKNNDNVRGGRSMGKEIEIMGDLWGLETILWSCCEAVIDARGAVSFEGGHVLVLLITFLGNKRKGTFEQLEVAIKQ